MMREGGHGGSPETEKKETAFDRYTRSMAETLIGSGVPGTKEEIYEYLHEGYDPRLLKYKHLLSERMLLNPGGPFLIPEGSEGYDAWKDIVFAPSKEEGLPGPDADIAEDLFQDVLSSTRAAALLYRHHFKKDPEDLLRQYLMEDLSSAIQEFGLRPPEHLRFLPTPKDSWKTEPLGDDVFEEAERRVISEYVEEGIDPRIAEKMLKAREEELAQDIYEVAEQVKEELLAFFDDPDFRDPAKLSSLVLGKLPN